jgi:hypothetical protein
MNPRDDISPEEFLRNAGGTTKTFPRLVEPPPEHEDEAPGAEEDQAQENPLGIWDAGDDDYDVSPREWLLGTVFCRRFLSSLIADGGVGKTALRLAQLISLALGRSLTGEHVFRRCRVLVLSFEDDRDELRRRVLAVLKHHHIEPAEIQGWLFLAAPKGLKLAELRDNAPAKSDLEALLRKAISAHTIDVVSLDPFVKTHGLEENNNNAIDYVCTLLASIAIEMNCAIDLPHHTSKGISPAAGDANRARGASAMKDAARLVYTLTPMTSDEAEMCGIKEAERRSFIRMDSGKLNIAPPMKDAKWFRLIGVPLGNGTDEYPNGDEVQTVEPWAPPDPWDDTDIPTINLILDDIDAGLENGCRYSAAGATKNNRAAWRAVQKRYPGKSEVQCRDMVRTWLRNGVLLEEPYHDPVEQKERIGLRVVASKRPGNK